MKGTLRGEELLEFLMPETPPMCTPVDAVVVSALGPGWHSRREWAVFQLPTQLAQVQVPPAVACLLHGCGHTVSSAPA